MSSSSIEVMSGESSVVQRKRKAEDNESDEAAPKDTSKQPTEITEQDPAYSPQDERTIARAAKRAKNEHLVVKVSEDTDFNAITVPVACEFCYEICADGKSLYEHMSVHENVEIRVFQCTYCATEFYNLTELQDHMQEHEQANKFECGVCNQMFSRKDSLRVHLRLHDKSKCFHCTVCSKPFLTSGSLEMHMRIHKGERPFECHLCGSSFTQKSHLMTHYQSHQNVAKTQRVRPVNTKVFKCQHCVKSFTRISDFEKHLQWQHSIGTSDKHFSAENGSAKLKQSVPMMNNLRLKYPPGNSVRTLCDAGTQTDDSPGHVIIPKKYQQDTENSIFPDQFDEIFDEGMDRNISSDEEDTNIPTMTYTAHIPSTLASTSKDDKFDAVLGIDPKKESVPDAPKNGETLAPKFPDVVEKPSEEPLPQDKVPPVISLPTEEELREVEKEVLIDLGEDDRPTRPSSPPKGIKSMSATFDTKWTRKYRSTKVSGKTTKPKVKVPSVLGLTGPAHLRLIRKSLQKFISEKAANKTETATSDIVEEPPLPKRASKVKQHAEDFICTSKTCTTCSPGAVTAPVPTLKAEAPETSVSSKPPPPPEKKIGESDDQSEKLLQFILVGDAESLEGTEYSVPKTDSRPSPVIDSPERFTTYSCKVCKEEFRFEGKLHRHLSIFHGIRPALSVNPRWPGPKRTVKRINVNPEVAALRSEWDDENEDTSTIEESAAIESKLDKIRARFHYTQQNLVPRIPGRMPVYQFTSKRRSPQKPTFTPKLPPTIKPSTTAPVSKDKPPLEIKCQQLLEKLFDANLLKKCGIVDEHVSVVLGKILQHYGVKRIEDYGQGQYEVLKYNLWRLIEWKVTMEQMEEFYVDGSSVEEMMDDIMFGRVPIISHVEPDQQAEKSPKKEPSEGTSQLPQNQLVQVADFLGGEISIGDGVTQVMLTQDMVSPEMLQGAQIVTLDASTGEVLSQVSADQMILTGEISQALGHPIQTVSEPVVARSVPDTEVVSTISSTSIIISDDASARIVEETPNSDSHQETQSDASCQKNEPS